MSTETAIVAVAERTTEFTTPAERLKAAEMPVLRRSAEELAAEQKACNIILNEMLGEKSMFIPEDLRRDPKAAIVLIAYARDAGLHVMEVLQNAFVVKGKISFNTKFLIAQLRRRFSIQPIFRFTGEGDHLACHVHFVDLTRVDSVHGDPLPVKDVEFSLSMKEGLASSNGSDVWKKQPKKMLMYRTAKMAIDTYWPGVLGFDSGEREEYVEWANAEKHTPTEGVRAVKIMGPPVPVDPKLEKLLAAPAAPAEIVAEKEPVAKIEPKESLLDAIPETETDETFQSLVDMIRKADTLEALQRIKSILSRVKKEVEDGAHPFVIEQDIRFLQDEFKERKEALS